jgi:hypothetical protein
MKSIFTVFSLVMALVFSAQAQGIEKAYTEACTCFKNLKGAKLTDDEKKAQGMECLQTVMLNNIEVLANESGYKPTDLNAETARAMGEKFGRKLVSKCPESLEFFMVAAQNLEEDSIGEVAAYLSSGTTEGSFVRLDISGDSPKLVVKTSDGSEETFLWIRQFKGADLLEKQYRTLANKKVSVQWGEFSKYVFTMKGYAKIKEIIGLTIN